jgi:hypothetical protein
MTVFVLFVVPAVKVLFSRFHLMYMVILIYQRYHTVCVMPHQWTHDIINLMLFVIKCHVCINNSYGYVWSSPLCWLNHVEIAYYNGLLYLCGQYNAHVFVVPSHGKCVIFIIRGTSIDNKNQYSHILKWTTRLDCSCCSHNYTRNGTSYSPTSVYI